MSRGKKTRRAEQRRNRGSVADGRALYEERYPGGRGGSEDRGAGRQRGVRDGAAVFEQRHATGED